MKPGRGCNGNKPRTGPAVCTRGERGLMGPKSLNDDMFSKIEKSQVVQCRTWKSRITIMDRPRPVATKGDKEKNGTTREPARKEQLIFPGVPPS